MAALTATDWTVVVQDRRIENGIRIHKCKLTLATAGSYPSNGIPYPSAQALGFKRPILDYIMMIDAAPTASYQIQNDYDNSSFRIFTDVSTDDPSLIELATTVTAGAGGVVVLYVEAKGS
jgi:hypothetical protein